MFASLLRRVGSLLLLFAAAQSLQAQTLRAEFAPLANFAYQLDCVSGARSQRSCAGADDFRALWKREFGIDTATSTDVKRWAALRKEYAVITSGDGPSDPAWLYGQINFDDRILIASFAAKDAVDYRSRLTLLLPDHLAPAAGAIVLSLYPVFETWWKRRGAALGKRASQAMIAELQSPPIKQQVNELFAFYGSPSAARAPHTVYLMFRPGFADKGLSSGGNFGATSVVEFFANTESRGQTPVIVHEYSHYVFGVMPKEQGVALRSSVINAGGEIGLPAWGLLDEALATAIGNGRVSRSLLTPATFEKFATQELSFYNVPNIDRSGKAILPLVDAFMASKRGLFDATFPAAYAAALNEKIAAALNTPATFLTDYSLVVDSGLGEGPEGGAAFASEFQSTSRNMSVIRCCDGDFKQAVQRGANGTGVIAVASSNFDKLANVLRLSNEKQTALNAALREQSAVGALLVSREAGSPPLILAVVNDAAALSRAAKLLAAMPTLQAGIVSVK